MKKCFCIHFLVCFFAIHTNAQQSKAHINHTAIYVVDIQKTGDFYSNIIGLDTVPEPFHDGKHIWYSTGAHTMLHVIAGATAKKDYYKNQHTCFTVPDFNQFIKKLQALNWPYEDVAGNKNAITTRVDGVHQIWLQDPDGYWLEINDDKY
ncbi:MAG: VOC family protein [Chitinophagia bacterium]|jgi:lactoylglutathione lyase